MAKKDRDPTGDRAQNTEHRSKIIKAGQPDPTEGRNAIGARPGSLTEAEGKAMSQEKYERRMREDPPGLGPIVPPRPGRPALSDLERDRAIKGEGKFVGRPDRFMPGPTPRDYDIELKAPKKKR